MSKTLVLPLVPDRHIQTCTPHKYRDMHTHTNMQTHAHKHIDRHMYTHTDIDTCIHTYLHIHRYI